jgi:hypothetical protein
MDNDFTFFGGFVRSLSIFGSNSSLMVSPNIGLHFWRKDFEVCSNAMRELCRINCLSTYRIAFIGKPIEIDFLNNTIV